MSKRTTKIAKRNPSPLGWVGIGVGATAAVALAYAGFVFYRLTKL